MAGFLPLAANGCIRFLAERDDRLKADLEPRRAVHRDAVLRYHIGVAGFPQDGFIERMGKG